MGSTYTASAAPSIDVTWVKRNLNLDVDFYEDDSFIDSLIAVALQQVLTDTRLTETEFNILVISNKGAMLAYAVVLLASYFYTNRDIITYGNAKLLPLSYYNLILPFKKYNRK